MPGYKSKSAMSREFDMSNNIELVCEEGKVFGTLYYTIKPIIPYWNSNDSVPLWEDMMQWCISTYGPTPIDGVWTPNAQWYANNSKFWFREKKDLEWFLLRWS
jgi:hypothetical protein